MLGRKGVKIREEERERETNRRGDVGNKGHWISCFHCVSTDV